MPLSPVIIFMYSIFLSFVHYNVFMSQFDKLQNVVLALNKNLILTLLYLSIDTTTYSSYYIDQKITFELFLITVS